MQPREVAGYLVVPVTVTHPYRGVDRRAFVPTITTDMSTAPAHGQTRTHAWEFARTAWEREAFKIYEEDLSPAAPDDLPLIAKKSTAERIKDIIEPYQGEHEVLSCHLVPITGIAGSLPARTNEGLFLGHDVAYPGGDFYSAILNGLYRNPHPELLRKFRSRLNTFGLFSAVSDLAEYLEDFRNLVPAERGSEFVVYELFLCGRSQ
jgi:hypothetical protein